MMRRGTDGVSTVEIGVAELSHDICLAMHRGFSVRSRWCLGLDKQLLAALASPVARHTKAQSKVSDVYFLENSVSALFFYI